MIATGGVWDATDRPVYFLAGQFSRIGGGIEPLHPYFLVAVNDVTSPHAIDKVDQLLDAGVRVLLDSGIFWLTNEHKRAHDVTMDEALALPPEAIDGFGELWERYVALVQRFGDRVWGYIELDQGGMENKRRTRTRLNDLGLNPMPVYHPLNDGWDYFDELAETHDRICWGNVVQAEAAVRKRMLVTAWERHRAYPDLWIHVLGLTPNQWLNAYPVDSADSSTWLSIVRWSPPVDRSMMRTLGTVDRDFMYVTGSDRDGDRGHLKAVRLSAIGVNAGQRSWRHWLDRLEAELGLPMYPAPDV